MCLECTEAAVPAAGTGSDPPWLKGRPRAEAGDDRLCESRLDTWGVLCELGTAMDVTVMTHNEMHRHSDKQRRDVICHLALLEEIS